MRERDAERERERELVRERDAARSALTEKERRAWKMALADERDGAALMRERAEHDEAERNMQRTQLSYLDTERRFLAQELTKAYRRPWRPLKYFLYMQILKGLAFTTRPFSTAAAARFERSAHKRRPRRFEIPPTDLRDSRTSSLPPEIELTSEVQREIFTFSLIDPPDVSIIIHAYKGLDDLETCLRSLSYFQHTEPSFEVILIDDYPSEPVLDNIPDSVGLIKIANRQTLGFPLSCNAGAAVARGRHLCFLGSNANVSSGWLRALVEAAEGTPRVAIAGPMLLDADGSIRDAGWRMLSDGWGRPIGRGRNSRDGAFTYRRFVDCVTGACFLVPSSTFKDLGGLDPSYKGGLHAVFDFSFRACALSLRTVYEPRSRVTYRGDWPSAEKRDEFSEANHAEFLTRFAKTLRTRPSDIGDEFVLRQGVDQGDVILVVDSEVPRPDHHAGGLTMALYLELLASAGRRVVFGPMYGSVEGPAAEALERRGIEVIRGTIDRWLSEHGEHVQKVWLAGTEVAARYLGVARAYSKARVIYYTHDLHHIRMGREAELRDDPVLRSEAAKMKLLELGVLLEADRICAPSELECREIQKLTMGKLASVLPPYFYEAGDLRPRGADHFSSRSDVVFVGGFPHIPNVDAALFIAREIMPLVWREIDWIRLVLVGYAPPKEVQALAGPRIVVTGYVPDVEPYMDQARVNLAALRFGAGVKGKVVEALRLGVPVVTTACGAEGVGIESGRDAIVAETPEALAQAVISLFRDADRCAEFSAASVELVKRRFSRALALSAIETIFTDM